MAETPGRDDSVGERAKAAALAVGLVTILAGTDPLDIRGSSHVFRALDYVLIGCWLAVVVLFLFAQTAAGGGDHPAGRRWLRIAVVGAGVAGTFTVVLLALAAAGISPDRDKVLMQVEPAELRAIASRCTTAHGRFHLIGSVTTATLNDEFVVLNVDTGRANSSCDQIRVPRDRIVALIEHPCAGDGIAARVRQLCRK
jgi:hypothetical protein